MDKDIKLGGVKNELALKTVAYKVFLQEILSFYLDSKSNSNFSSKIDFCLNFDDLDSDNKALSNNKNSILENSI